MRRFSGKGQQEESSHEGAKARRNTAPKTDAFGIAIGIAIAIAIGIGIGIGIAIGIAIAISIGIDGNR